MQLFRKTSVAALFMAKVFNNYFGYPECLEIQISLGRCNHLAEGNTHMSHISIKIVISL